MENDKNKTFTAQEVAQGILDRCRTLYKDSKLAKSNTAHELEVGSEPHNEDSEAPEQLQAGEVCKPDSGDKKKKKKGEGESEEGEESSDSQPEHEEGMSEEEDFAHDAKENQDDESDEDNIEADEEESEEEEDEEKEKKMEKSESMMIKTSKLRNFINKTRSKRSNK